MADSDSSRNGLHPRRARLSACLRLKRKRKKAAHTHLSFSLSTSVLQAESEVTSSSSLRSKPIARSLPSRLRRLSFDVFELPSAFHSSASLPVLERAEEKGRSAPEAEGERRATQLEEGGQGARGRNVADMESAREVDEESRELHGREL